MSPRRQTAEHPFGTIKAGMGATHFLTMTLPRVATEMALNVLANNLKRAIAMVASVRWLRPGIRQESNGGRPLSHRTI
jgi:hypothetical protein